MAKGELEHQYEEIGQALSNWFISQEIATPIAAGAMCYLVGIIIATAAYDRVNMEIGVNLHQGVMAKAARIAYQEMGK